MTEKQFQKIFSWVTKSPVREKGILFLNKWLPWILAVFFGLFSIWRIFSGQDVIALWLRPALCFIVVTIFRKCLNKQRPYDRLGFKPLADYTPGKGKSFPSRHVFSIAMIAMTFLRVSLPLAVLFFVLTALLAALRVLGGVHYVRDVAAGAAMGVLCGLLGFFIL